MNANGTSSSSSRRRRLLANTIAGGATSGVSSSLSSAATASSGTNQTINVTASATEGSDSPTVDMDAAVLASIAGEISVISNQISASMAGLDDMITAIAASGGNPSAYKQRIADYWKSLLVAADETTKGLQSQAEETLRVLDATISVQQEALNSVLELEVLLKKQADELKAALDALGEDTNNELGKACQFRLILVVLKSSSTSRNILLWECRRLPQPPRLLRLCRLHLHHLRLHHHHPHLLVVAFWR